MNRAVFAFVLALVGCGGKVDWVAGSGSGATSTTATTGGGQGGTGGANTTCDPDLHTLQLDDYDTACVDASDCTAVFIGDLCGLCDCPTAAIRSDALPQYKADLAVKEAGTPPNECLCPAFPKACIDGHCTLP